MRFTLHMKAGLKQFLPDDDQKPKTFKTNDKLTKIIIYKYIYIYIYIYNVSPIIHSTHLNTPKHTHTHTDIYIYLFIFIFIWIAPLNADS